MKKILSVGDAKYVIARGPWLESCAVGIAMPFICLVLIPIALVLLLGVSVAGFVCGITGFLKRVE